MFRMLAYLFANGVVTARSIFPELEEGVRGLPTVTSKRCQGSQCNACQTICPTDAINVSQRGDCGQVSLDLGACIGCGLCVDHCPTDSIINNRNTKTAVLSRRDLQLATGKAIPNTQMPARSAKGIFKRSIAVRVVSTGCSACDLEVAACGNPIFDMERFGVHIVASPRFADVLAVTGPVPKAMHEPLRRCYDAMAEPRLVVAIGTCAISGGIHKNAYTEADGVDKIIPVNVYVPGCPPHPWSIIYGIKLAMTSI